MKAAFKTFPMRPNGWVCIPRDQHLLGLWQANVRRLVSLKDGDDTLGVRGRTPFEALQRAKALVTRNGAKVGTP